MSIASMLVPVSLSARDEKVLRYVSGLREQSVRRVIVATAVDTSGMEAPVAAVEVDRCRARLAEMAHVLDGSGMEVETRVMTGPPADAIQGLAREAGVDVICLGSEGKSAVDFLFSGSVSESVFTSGRARTMVVRYGLLESVEDPSEVGRDFAKRLVVPTDFSESAERAWLSAFDRPAEAIGEVHAIVAMAPEASPPERERALAELARLKGVAAEHGVQATTSLRHGSPLQVILGYLSEVKATGVITGQRGRGTLRRMVLGSTSLSLLREAQCPVVVQP